MAEPEIDSLKLFTDGLTLLYHEARHVRFLIKAGHLEATGWGQLVSLPKNRVEAWRQLQGTRQAARDAPTPDAAKKMFQQELGRSLADLHQLYENPNWKHAKSVGGHAWRDVCKLVANLGLAINQGDSGAKAKSCAALLQARHNNGPLRQKITALDNAVGAATDSWWNQSTLDS